MQIFKTNDLRLKNVEKLKKVIESILKKYNANYWIKKIGLEGVPVSKLNNIQEVLEHPQIIIAI